MRKFNTHQLRDFLNFDTNTRNFLSFSERLIIHKAIAIQLTGFNYKSFPSDLQMKLIDCLQSMKRQNWESVSISYKFEDNEYIQIKREI